ncbi:MAG: hypothetical protein EOM67_14545 [Spirochaetia bacterium]|nr:hypothetical protein [Spirochaetia bacterium]
MEEKLSRKDLYQELWRGRDLELTSLWQRSIFLLSFLVIAFTAYCGLWVVLFSQEDSSIHELLLMDLGFVCISVFGLVASVLWIMMSKGSKYWYEKYEGSISRIIEDRELNSNELANNDRQTESNNGDPVLLMNTVFTEYPRYYPRHGYLENIALNRNQVNSCLLSTKAGAFSVSKVNIGIGIVTGWLWLLLITLHIFFLWFLCNSSNAVNELTSSYINFSGITFFEMVSPDGQAAVSLLVGVLPRWSLWIGFIIPGLFLIGFIVMCWYGLFSSSESKILIRRNIKKKLKYYFLKKRESLTNAKSEESKHEVADQKSIEDDLFRKFLNHASGLFCLNEDGKRKVSNSEVNSYSHYPLFNHEEREKKLVNLAEYPKYKAVLYKLNYRELCYLDTLLNRILYEPDRVKREILGCL